MHEQSIPSDSAGERSSPARPRSAPLTVHGSDRPRSPRRPLRSRPRPMPSATSSIGLQADLETAAEISYYSRPRRAAMPRRSRHGGPSRPKSTTPPARSAGLQDRLGTRAAQHVPQRIDELRRFRPGCRLVRRVHPELGSAQQDERRTTPIWFDQTKTLREELQAAKDEFARQEQIASAKAAEAKQIQSDVQAKVDQATELVSSLDAEAQELLQQEQAAAAAAAAAEAAAEAERQRQAQQAANPGGGGGASGGSGSGSGGGSGSSGGGGGGGSSVSVPSGRSTTRSWATL